VKASKFVSSLSSYAPTPTQTKTSSHSQGHPQHLHQQSSMQQQNSMSAPHSPSRKHTPTTLRSHGRPSQNSIVMGSPRLQSIQVQESLRDTYAQTKQALQNSSGGPNDIDGGIRFRTSISGELQFSSFYN